MGVLGCLLGNVKKKGRRGVEVDGSFIWGVSRRGCDSWSAVGEKRRLRGRDMISMCNRPNGGYTSKRDYKTLISQSGIS